jgi:chromosome segregation ATPase
VDLPVPEWAYQLVISTLFGGVLYLWKYFNGRVDSLIEKLETAREEVVELQDRISEIEAAYAAKFEQLYRDLLDRSD